MVALDKRYVWHPYTEMGAYIEGGRPLVIDRAAGSRVFDADGRGYLDGNSSWWCALLGHNHPRLVGALVAQAGRLCHTALAGATHAPAAHLARELVAAAPSGLTRVFFSDDGSTAVEIAAKMAVQYFRQNGQPSRRRLVALEGAFHGDTVGAASLGGVEVFRQPFGALLFDVVRVPSPATASAWGEAFSVLEAAVDGAGDEIAAVFVEPVVQGAAGMRIYDPAYLASVRRACSRRGVLLVADEVFSGYGRTGPMWGCDHAAISPDILCTAKGFSGGVLPMAATLVTEELFLGFTGAPERAFLHGHTFTGNPLGAAVAREVLAVYRDEGIVAGAARRGRRLARAVSELRPRLGDARCRSLGMIAAVDLGGGGYRGGAGWRVYEHALDRGAWMRPLGDTVYLTPPLNIDDQDLDRLCSIFVDAVIAATS